MVTSLDQLDPNGSCTYADHLLWQFQEWVELLRGKIRQMAASSMKHQHIIRRLTRDIANALWKIPYQVFVAPFDVRLTNTRNDKEVNTVVQPDLCVICDLSKLDDRGCNGAPDLIIEILSLSNSRTEMMGSQRGSSGRFERLKARVLAFSWMMGLLGKTDETVKM
jgi:Uma2 family endonuclease